MLAVVPHVRQLEMWDCGLACVAAVLEGIGIRNSVQTLSEIHKCESPWTIHLAYILRHYGVSDFTFYTSYIGVNYSHKKQQFYQSTVSEEYKEVHQLFLKAREQQVRIIPLILNMENIKRFLISNRYAIIILVNINELACNICAESAKVSWKQWIVSIIRNRRELMRLNNNADSSGSKNTCGVTSRPDSPTFSNCSSSTSVTNGMVSTPPRMKNVADSWSSKISPKYKSKSLYKNSAKGFLTCGGICSSNNHGYELVNNSYEPDFVGHYVVLIGYDSDSDSFYYRDPGTSEELCKINSSVLERAKNSPGTDHDMIVIKLL